MGWIGLWERSSTMTYNAVRKVSRSRSMVMSPLGKGHDRAIDFRRNLPVSSRRHRSICIKRLGQVGIVEIAAALSRKVRTQELSHDEYEAALWLFLMDVRNEEY